MNEKIDKDIVVETSGAAIADDSIIALADKAEQRVEAVNKIKKLSLRVTNHHDWVDQNGKPYLQASGGEKVARLFGISWCIDEPTFNLDDDGHFEYIYTGKFTLGGASIEAVGTRNSRDPFFKKYRYEKNKPRVELPPSEIDKGDVRKAAFTNLIANGVTRLLGIRNLTYEDLKSAGIDVSKITKVEYKNKGKEKGKPAVQDPDATATDNQIRAVNTMLGKLGMEGDERFDWLTENVKVVVNSTKELTKGDASKCIEALQKALKDK